MTPQSLMQAAYDLARRLGFSVDAANALRAILSIEGALVYDPGGSDIGDSGSSFGPLQFHKLGQLPAYANYLGKSVPQAGEFARRNPLDAIQWALSNYLGTALTEGERLGHRGADLATYAQTEGQRSRNPQVAGQAYIDLFGGTPAQGRQGYQPVSFQREGTMAEAGTQSRWFVQDNGDGTFSVVEDPGTGNTGDYQVRFTGTQQDAERWYNQNAGGGGPPPAPQPGIPQPGQGINIGMGYDWAVYQYNMDRLRMLEIPEMMARTALERHRLALDRAIARAEQTGLWVDPAKLENAIQNLPFLSQNDLESVRQQVRNAGGNGDADATQVISDFLNAVLPGTQNQLVSQLEAYRQGTNTMRGAQVNALYGGWGRAINPEPPNQLLAQGLAGYGRSLPDAA